MNQSGIDVGLGRFLIGSSLSRGLDTTTNVILRLLELIVDTAERYYLLKLLNGRNLHIALNYARLELVLLRCFYTPVFSEMWRSRKRRLH